VRHHHENWDGTGYPDGLAGEAIPVGARVLQVVDCFDALTSDRPYRPALDVAEALAIIRARRGTMYDPRVVDAFETLVRDGAGVELPAASPVPAASPGAGAASAPPPQTPAVADVFFALGRDLAGGGDAARVGGAIWRRLAPLVPASACVLFVHDDASDALVPAFTAGAAIVHATTRVPVGERLSGWVAATRRPALNSDARLDMDPEQRAEATLHGALAVPVLTPRGVAGVLTCYAVEANAFTPDQAEFLEAAARVAASALHVAAPRLEAVAV
jgi:hypothetical protein